MKLQLQQQKELKPTSVVDRWKGFLINIVCVIKITQKLVLWFFILAAAVRAADVDFSHKKQLQAMAWFANMHGTFYCPIKFSVLLSRECWFSPLVLLVVNRFIFGLSLSWICFRQKSPRKMANYNFFIKQPFLKKNSDDHLHSTRKNGSWTFLFFLMRLRKDKRRRCAERIL